MMRFALFLVFAWPLIGEGGGRAAHMSAMRAQFQSVRLMKASIERQRSAIASRRAPVRVAVEPSLFHPPDIFLAPAVPVGAAACDPLPEPQLAPLIESASAKSGLAAGLLRAVIGQESSNYPCAVSGKGALGLMQLMPATARDLEVSDPFDPTENVEAGSRYLKQLLLRYDGNLPLALGAYNAGPARVDQWMRIPPIAETQNFVERILTRLAGAAALRD